MERQKSRRWAKTEIFRKWDRRALGTGRTCTCEHLVFDKGLKSCPSFHFCCWETVPFFFLFWVSLVRGFINVTDVLKEPAFASFLFSLSSFYFRFH